MELIVFESVLNICGNREYVCFFLIIWLVGFLLWLKVYVFVICVNNMVCGINSFKLVSC